MTIAPIKLSYHDIDRAADRLRGIAHRTPVLTSTTINDRTKSQVFFKCENFQRIVLGQVQDMVTVSDAAIARSMFYLWERLKIVVEPTGALAAAAILEGIQHFRLS
jgi:threonine dehydratase